MNRYWTWWRVAAWVGFGVLFLAYAQLAFRHDSSFFTVWWMPREMARRILKLTYYRNFWGFGFLGLYASMFLATGWKVWEKGGIRWWTGVLWVLPVAKELVQVLVRGRHGTLFGAACGLLGMGAGLLLGTAGLAAANGRWKGGEATEDGRGKMGYGGKEKGGKVRK